MLLALFSYVIVTIDERWHMDDPQPPQAAARHRATSKRPANRSDVQSRRGKRGSHRRQRQVAQGNAPAE